MLFANLANVFSEAEDCWLPKQRALLVYFALQFSYIRAYILFGFGKSARQDSFNAMPTPASANPARAAELRDLRMRRLPNVGDDVLWIQVCFLGKARLSYLCFFFSLLTDLGKFLYQ